MPTVPAPAPAVASVTGARIGAAIIDLVLAIILFVAMAATIGDFGDGTVSLTGFPALLFAVIVLGYYFVADAYLGGKTAGKAVTGLSVVSDSGLRLTLGQAALRTVLRIVDGLPVFYLVGFITMLATGGKRIGDLAAGSKVVRGG
jgi:uncharacterized RDD family membrane protein YckC